MRDFALESYAFLKRSIKVFSAEVTAEKYVKCIVPTLRNLIFFMINLISIALIILFYSKNIFYQLINLKRWYFAFFLTFVITVYI